MLSPPIHVRIDSEAPAPTLVVGGSFELGLLGGAMIVVGVDPAYVP